MGAFTLTRKCLSRGGKSSPKDYWLSKRATRKEILRQRERNWERSAILFRCLTAFLMLHIHTILNGLLSPSSFVTLKDFYSHSNWVELGNTVPNSNLIRSDTSIGNIAGMEITGVCLWWRMRLGWGQKLNVDFPLPQRKAGRRVAAVLETTAGTTSWKTSSRRKCWRLDTLVSCL